jgi:hypothetical protein
MSSISTLANVSRRRLWTGRILTGLVGLFMLFDGGIKVLRLAPAINGTVELGYPAHDVFAIGLLALSCLVLYLIPRTAILGAVLLTGYLGGAIATHLRVGNPLFTHTLFPVYVAALIWGGLALRDGRLRLLLGAPRTV